MERDRKRNKVCRYDSDVQVVDRCFPLVVLMSFSNSLYKAEPVLNVTISSLSAK